MLLFIVEALNKISEKIAFNFNNDLWHFIVGVFSGSEMFISSKIWSHLRGNNSNEFSEYHHYIDLVVILLRFETVYQHKRLVIVCAQTFFDKVTINLMFRMRQPNVLTFCSALDPFFFVISSRERSHLPSSLWRWNHYSGEWNSTGRISCLPPSQNLRFILWLPKESFPPVAIHYACHELYNST